MKATYLRRKAASLEQQGAYGRAIDRYTEALQLLEGLPTFNSDKLFIQRNCLVERSAALEHVGRHHEALQDAESAVAMLPGWPLAHWRRGRALEGLSRLPEALEAHVAAWVSARKQQEEDCCIFHQAAVRCLDKFTLQQLADGLLKLLEDLVQRGSLSPADGTVGTGRMTAELREAAFLIVKGNRGSTAQQYLGWLTQGVPAWEAYLLRSRLYRIISSFGQAQLDAFKSVELLCHTLPPPKPVQDNTAQKDLDTTLLPAALQLAGAYMALAEAYMACSGHPLRDLRKAVVCLSHASFLNPEATNASQLLAQVSSQLSDREMALAIAESEGWGGLLGLLSEGITLPDADTPQEVHRVDLYLRIASPAGCRPQQYSCKALMEVVAVVAHVPARDVVLDQVLHPTADDPWTYIRLKVPVVGSSQRAQEVCQGLQEQQAVESITAVFRQPDNDDSPLLMVRANSTDISVTCQKFWEQKQHFSDELALVRPPPKDLQVVEEETSLTVPYKHYFLADAAGALVERPYKHPFCMSRVHYSGSDHGQYVWVETSDGACRWRQSASEVCVIATKVPCGTPARELEVCIESFYLKVSNSQSGEVYLEGELERGIIPEDSVWTCNGGKGEEGCILYLEKMNLELYQQYWQHSRSWWPRLMTHHADIAWDDYDKDYSDLPREIMAAYQHQEQQQRVVRHQEALENHHRKQVQDRLDARRRSRREHLLRALQTDL